MKKEIIASLEGEVLRSVFNVNTCCDLSSTNWVKNYGTKYQIGVFIIWMFLFSERSQTSLCMISKLFFRQLEWTLFIWMIISIRTLSMRDFLFFQLRGWFITDHMTNSFQMRCGKKHILCHIAMLCNLPCGYFKASCFFMWCVSLKFKFIYSAICVVSFVN